MEWNALARWGQLPAWEPLRPGFRLRAAREAAKVTQAELARRLGVTQQAVAQAERAASNPTVAFAETWARALGAVLTFEVLPLPPD
ncbi:MAG: helix-turn-helix transcriptional regulator [Thermoanaerobaculia bacterium]